MAKKEQKARPAGVRHNNNAPCAQGFCVEAKPGKKSKTWWNGYRKPSPSAETS